MYAGVKLLTNQTVNNYALAQVTDGDGIVDITNGFADIEKYYMISNTSIPEASTISDMVQFTGAGPFDLMVGDTVIVGFAIVAGDNLYEFEQSIEQSQIVYNEVLHSNNIANVKLNGFLLYPNPASNEVLINSDNYSLDYVVLNIFNFLGELIYTEEFQHSTMIDVSSYDAGIYNFELISPKGTFVEKLVVAN
jgi:hypothetical protein